MRLITSDNVGRFGIAFLLGLLIPFGCALQPQSPSKPSVSSDTPSASPTPEPTITRRPPSEAPQVEPTYSQPVATLLAKAETELNAGQLDLSAASLERAIRISPRTPLLWQRLAQVNLRQGDARQAEAMALKSNSLISAELSLYRKNWELIAEARWLLGDAQGARKAAEEARRADVR